MEENGLSINKMKTASMFVEATKSRRPEDILVKLSGHSLEVVSSTRCLGIVIGDQLSWKDHVDFVCAKVGEKLVHLDEQECHCHLMQSVRTSWE